MLEPQFKPAVGAMSVLAAVALPAYAAGRPGYKVTVSAAGTAPGSLKGKVDGYALVVYKVARQDTGAISGIVTAAAGDRVLL